MADIRVEGVWVRVNNHATKFLRSKFCEKTLDHLMSQLSTVGTKPDSDEYVLYRHGGFVIAVYVKDTQTFVLDTYPASATSPCMRPVTQLDLVHKLDVLEAAVTSWSTFSEPELCAVFDSDVPAEDALRAIRSAPFLNGCMLDLAVRKADPTMIEAVLQHPRLRITSGGSLMRSLVGSCVFRGLYDPAKRAALVGMLLADRRVVAAITATKDFWKILFSTLNPIDVRMVAKVAAATQPHVLPSILTLCEVIYAAEALGGPQSAPYFIRLHKIG
jgi:hypothetical protein